MRTKPTTGTGRRLSRLSAVLLGLTLFAVACGGDSAEDPAAEEPAAAEPAAEPAEEPAAAEPVEEPAEPVEEPAEEPAAAEPVEEPDSGPRELVINTSTGFGGLDPAGCLNFSDAILNQFYVQLTRYGTTQGPDGTRQVDPDVIEPYFATGWDVSDNSTVYTFTIPEGATFPSGGPVDAAAVKFSLDRVNTIGSCGAYLVNNGLPGNISSVTAPDETTVIVELNNPDPDYAAALATLNASIVDPSIIEAEGPIEQWVLSDTLSTGAAGSGPYQLVSFDPVTGMVMEANPDFFGDPPAFDRVTVNVVTSDATLLLQAESGEADVTIGLSPTSAAALEGSDGLNILVHQQRSAEQLLMPWDTPPFDDPDVRRALTLALPYEDLVTQIAEGRGDLFYGPIIPGLRHFDASLAAPLTFDMEQAQQTLEDAGIASLPDVDLIISQGNLVHEQLATVVQAQWAELGLNVNIVTLSAADYGNSLFGLQFEAAIRSDGPGVFDPGFYLGYDMRCEVIGLGANLSRMCIPEADALLDEARQSDDPDRQAELYGEIAGIWREASPKVIFWGQQAITVVNEEVTSFVYDPNLKISTWS